MLSTPSGSHPRAQAAAHVPAWPRFGYVGTRPAFERRIGERRVDSEKLWTRHSVLGGKRVSGRRAEDRVGYVADQHGSGLFAIVGAVLLFNVLDALFTLIFLSQGGIEANPIVDWALIQWGYWPFLAFKSVGIGVCVAFLTVTKNYRPARIGLAVVFAGYAVLLGWHLYLYANLEHFLGS